MKSIAAAPVRTILATLVLMLGLLTASHVASAPSAVADAEGCQPYSPITVLKYVVPRGVMCHEIDGSGNNITSQEVAVYTVNTCNWRIDFVYKDLNGATWYRDTGTYHTGCSIPYRTRGSGWAKDGSACAQMWVSGKLIVQQCHRIF